MKYEVQKTKCGGYIVNHQGVDKWVSHAIEDVEQSLAETQAKLDKAVEALEFCLNQIERRIKYKPSHNAQGRIDAIDKVLVNEAKQTLQELRSNERLKELKE